MVLAGTLLCAGAIIIGACWLLSLRAATVKAVELDLRESIAAQQKCDWLQASVALDRAHDRLGVYGSGDLHRRLDQARADLTLVNRLDEIRLNVLKTSEDVFPRQQADAEYVAAFTADGFDAVAHNPEAFAAQITKSNIRLTLISALDEWFICTQDAARRDRLNNAARFADTDSAWRTKVRARTSPTDPQTSRSWLPQRHSKRSRWLC